MLKLSIPIRFIVVAVLSFSFATGCTKEARKSRLLKKAESDLKAGAYDKAKIEYLNVLRLDGQNPTAIAQLGKIWFDEGVPLKAGGFLVKLRELSPNELENRLRLAQVYSAVGKRSDARTEAFYVLEHSPANGGALLLLSQLASTPEEVGSFETTLNSFPEKESAPYYLAAANLAMRRSNPPLAQEMIEKALARDPKSAEAHRSRAILLLLQKKPEDASVEFKAAAELSPPRSSLKINYAEFLSRLGKSAEAAEYLEGLTKKTPDLLPAWSLRARAALSDKGPDQALSLLENVFSRDPDNVDARLVQASALLAKKQTQKAVDVLESLDRSHPGAPGIKFELAQAYLRDDKTEQASAALSKAIDADPNFTDAILLQADIDLRNGRAARAVSALEALEKKQGKQGRAQVLLADAYRAAGRLDDAAAIFEEQIKQSPQNTKAYLFLGLIQEQQKKTEAARRSFEKAFELAPGNLLALSKLIDLDLLAKDFDAAMQKAEQQMQKAPDAGSSYLLKGKVLTAKKDWPAAEAALKKAIEMDPGTASAYDLLVGIYLETGKSEQAIAELETVLKKSPQNKGALMTLASVYEKRGDHTTARDTYERLLALDPNEAAVLNNLAYIYAEHLGQTEKGLELARKARSLAPGNAAVSDTFGWVLFKSGDYQQAVALLEEAASRIGDDPEVRFHLGMAHYLMGQGDAAKSDFERALGMGKDFPSKNEAERRLDLLGRGASGSGALTPGHLEGMLAEHPNDIVARLRLAEVYKTEGEFDRAATAYEEALKLNPKLADVTLELAQLYSGPLKNPRKALEFAKRARDLVPADPRAAGTLGRIAYQAGNFSWAYSLLQESSRQSGSDATVMHDFAWAAYSLGKIDQAREAMEQALKSAPAPQIAADGKSFLILAGAELNPAALAAAKPEIEQKLKSDPTYVPALMGAAALDASAGRTQQAVERYRSALLKFPDFAPAQMQMARLLSKDPNRLAEAYDLAANARKALPGDPEVALLLGKLSFEKKEYSRALQLLQESARKAPLDAEGLYYLGRSLQESKRPEEARKSLEAALAAGLPEPLTAEAQRILAEVRQP